MVESVMGELGGQPGGITCSMTLNEAPVRANAAAEKKTSAGRLKSGCARLLSSVPFVCQNF